MKKLLLLCAATHFILVGCASKQPKKEAPNYVLYQSSEDAFTELDMSVFTNDYEMFERQIKLGAPINRKTSDGVTTLMRAVQYGRTDMVKKLLKAGANFRMRDELNRTAVIYAFLSKNDEIMNILLKAGSEADAIWTPKNALQSSDGNKYVGSLKFLKPHGKGTLTTADGTYTGEFRDGNFHGKGVEILSDGTRFEGRYKNGERHGRGVFTTTDGRTKAVEYINGEPKRSQ